MVKKTAKPAPKNTPKQNRVQRKPATTIEKEYAKQLGLKNVDFTDEDREVIARMLVDVLYLGSGHLMRKGSGRLKRIDAKHVKIDLDIRKA